MPLGRKHLRRSRDAPTGGMAIRKEPNRSGYAGLIWISVKNFLQKSL
jgi:hypothetical protein